MVRAYAGYSMDGIGVNKRLNIYFVVIVFSSIQ